MGHDAAPALVAAGLTRRFGQRPALRDVSFTLVPGELTAVIGANGAGKTTLLSILAGVLAPSGGSVTVAAAARIGWIPQETALYAKLSVIENLRLFARLERLEDPEAAARAMVAQMGLDERAAYLVGTLSGGNRQRVNVGLGLLAEPAVLLLDEPTAALDPEQRARLWEFVRGFAARGTAVPFTTHDLTEAHDYAGRVLRLEDGALSFAGAPSELRL